MRMVVLKMKFVGDLGVDVKGYNFSIRKGGNNGIVNISSSK